MTDSFGSPRLLSCLDSPQYGPCPSHSTKQGGDYSHQRSVSLLERSTEGFPAESEKIPFYVESLHRTARQNGFTLGKSPRFPKETSEHGSMSGGLL